MQCSFSKAKLSLWPLHGLPLPGLLRKPPGHDQQPLLVTSGKYSEAQGGLWNGFQSCPGGPLRKDSASVDGGIYIC